MPNETIIYFGDTAHLPYGDKSPDLIHSFVKNISKFLIRKEKCKSVVIACNTASAISYEFLRDKHVGNVPIFNVIDPIVEAISEDGLVEAFTDPNSQSFNLAVQWHPEYQVTEDDLYQSIFSAFASACNKRLQSQGSR